METAIDDPVLGPLAWDAGQYDWCGSLVLPSGRVAALRVSPQTTDHAERPDAPGVFAGAYPLVRWLRACEAEAVAAVAAALLPLYNDTWREAEPPITAAEFARRVELVEVTVPSSGAYVNLWFTDGEAEMFGGHAITAYFAADGRLQTAALSG